MFCAFFCAGPRHGSGGGLVPSRARPRAATSPCTEKPLAGCADDCASNPCRLLKWPKLISSHRRPEDVARLFLAGFHEEGRVPAAALVREPELPRGLAPGAARRPRRPRAGRRGARAAGHTRQGGNRRRRGTRWIGRVRCSTAGALMTPSPDHCCVYKLLPDIIQAKQCTASAIRTRCREQC